ncbi:hypothetical protein CDL15_Pgr015061 [Punica granatum]|uniref:Uncharacterized protein n=1 Tax=Punica granatum TaxID=22663 RepID=A0A218X1M5_PUNGR|nr:hypothetical protein CDL15_Pgr015061 [Punica granatum]PKI71155.1 hypothetical protein CRG98_008453 [Punica granatum]
MTALKGSTIAFAFQWGVQCAMECPPDPLGDLLMFTSQSLSFLLDMVMEPLAFDLSVEHFKRENQQVAYSLEGVSPMERFRRRHLSLIDSDKDAHPAVPPSEFFQREEKPSH